MSEQKEMRAATGDGESAANVPGPRGRLRFATPLPHGAPGAGLLGAP